MKDPSIRLAVEADLGHINDIYNYYVACSTSTYQVEPFTLEDQTQWFGEHQEPYFATVAEMDGKVTGWAAVSRFKARAAYGKTVENSVYVQKDWRHKGIGSALMGDLIKRAQRAGFHTVIAAISDDQIPSKKLHEKFGFSHGGKINEVGNKFGRWLDVSYMQLML